MEYISASENAEVAKILCCQCGTSITPNEANMCVGCIRARVDITEGIPKQATLQFCKACERYLQPPSDWVHCNLESKELLTLCLKKLKGLNRVKLVDAGFIWTEPHSKRIKVKLTVHGEVLGGAILEQIFVVEFTVALQMCDDCHRIEAQDYWHCLVQVRQRCNTKKTFFYLEQTILKYKAHDKTLGIKPAHEGLDFFFANEAHGRKMVDFVSSVLPCKTQHTKKLISHDIHSNNYNYKFTFSIEIVPLAKDSLVCLPKKLCQQMGGINPLCLVLRITNFVRLIHPATAQVADLSNAVFWRDPFNSISNTAQLVEFIVMNIDVIPSEEYQKFRGQGAISHKHLLADAWVVKSSELGINDNPIHTRTHLGAILKPGDSVLGYALADFNVNDVNFDKLNPDQIPDVILVKKFYGERRERSKARPFKLRHLEGTTDTNHEDFQEFLEDLEDDAEYRQKVTLYRSENDYKNYLDFMNVTTDEMNDPTCPKITLAEMLEDLQIDEPMDEMEEVDEL